VVVSSPGSGSFRVLRGVVLALVSIVLAVVGHTLGGGSLPSLGATMLALCFAVPACWLFACRRRRTTGITVTCAAVQLAAHGFFVLDGCQAPVYDSSGARMLAAHGAMTVVVAAVLARLDTNTPRRPKTSPTFPDGISMSPNDSV
jgi:hypothetical protein